MSLVAFCRRHFDWMTVIDLLVRMLCKMALNLELSFDLIVWKEMQLLCLMLLILEMCDDDDDDGK